MKKQFNKFFMFAMMIGFFIGMGQGKANALLTQCPVMGADAGCAVLLTIGSGGVLGISYDGTQGPYDSIEDTLVGVQNNSGATLNSLNLSGSNIFGFEGDGGCTYVTCTWSNPTGYEGPGTSFTVANSDNGTVNFIGGLADAGTTWFTLEENLSCGQNTCSGLTGGGVVTGGGSVPEPGSLLMLGSGLVGLALFGRKKLFN